MFSQACVKNSVHGGWQTPPSGQTPPLADTPPPSQADTPHPVGRHPPRRDSQQAGGTHTTGMLSCLVLGLRKL